MSIFSFFSKFFEGERAQPSPGEMKVLVIGGSGYVGRLILPLLAPEFRLVVYDLVEPPKGPWLFQEGDVLNEARLLEACRGMDAMIYLAMGKPDKEISVSYDLNAKGTHLALEAAVKAGIRRVIYASSLSVYEGLPDFKRGAVKNEETSVMPKNVYGLTKFFGEEICRFFSRRQGIPVFVLRLFLPVSAEDKKKEIPKDAPDSRTGAPDLVRAFKAALLSKHPGFEIIHITGDRSGKAYSHEKAKMILGWEPEL